VCERDVDLLLLEEFVASPDFRSWFLSQIGVEQTAVLAEAHHSVTTANGESDLELTFQGSSGVVKILIENKVDAAFRPNQPERYTARASQYKDSGNFQEISTVVMAPDAYFGDEPEAFGFDAKVSYESALAWFKRADVGERKQFKLAMLQGAIERGRLGWKPVPNRAVSEFWQAYWKLCEQVAPQLAMPVPKSEIPAQSHFILFRPAVLPANLTLWHKVAYGNVDLQFAGMGERLAEMERLYRPSLLPSMRIEKAAKSAVVRIRVDPVDMTSTAFSSAETTMRKGIEAAVQLVEWYSKLKK